MFSRGNKGRKMFVNMHMKNFNQNDFQNICRACMSEGDLETLQNGHMKVLNLISKVQYSSTDELPQKICEKCVRKINDIMAFALLCKRIDQTLKKYLENLKIENITIDLNTSEPAPNGANTEEITIVEEKIEFIDVNEHVDVETNYVKLELERLKSEVIRAELDEAARTSAAAIVAPVAPPTPAPISRALLVATPTEQQPKCPSQRGVPKPRPYQCSYCVRTFTLPGIRRSHERKIHRAASKHKCYTCQTILPHAYALKQHKKTHRKTYQCGECGRYLQSLYHLNNHRKTHQPDKEKPYECMICFKQFHCLQTYLKHNAVHGTFQCDVCNKTFAGAGSLARHNRTHHK